MKSRNMRERGNSYQYFIKRKKILQSIGIESGEFAFTCQSKSDGDEKYDAIIADLDKGIIPAVVRRYAESKQKQSSFTVGEIYARMMADNTCHFSNSFLGQIGPVLTTAKNIQMQKYTKTELMDWIGELKKAELKPGTIRKKVGALSRVFQYAVEQELLEKNIFNALPKNYSQYRGYNDKDNNSAVIRDVARDRRLLPGEEEKILEYINNYPYDARLKEIDPVLRDSLAFMFHMAINTAMRLQELFLAKWQDIDLDNQVINIRAINTKKAYHRTVRISKELYPLMVE